MQITWIIKQAIKQAARTTTLPSKFCHFASFYSAQFYGHRHGFTASDLNVNANQWPRVCVLSVSLPVAELLLQLGRGFGRTVGRQGRQRGRGRLAVQIADRLLGRCVEPAVEIARSWRRLLIGLRLHGRFDFTVGRFVHPFVIVHLRVAFSTANNFCYISTEEANSGSLLRKFSQQTLTGGSSETCCLTAY